MGKCIGASKILDYCSTLSFSCSAFTQNVTNAPTGRDWVLLLHKEYGMLSADLFSQRRKSLAIPALRRTAGAGVNRNHFALTGRCPAVFQGTRIRISPVRLDPKRANHIERVFRLVFFAFVTQVGNCMRQ